MYIGLPLPSSLTDEQEPCLILLHCRLCGPHGGEFTEAMGRLSAEAKKSRLLVRSAENAPAVSKLMVRGDKATLLVSLWKSSAWYVFGKVKACGSRHGVIFLSQAKVFSHNSQLGCLITAVSIRFGISTARYLEDGMRSRKKMKIDGWWKMADRVK